VSEINTDLIMRVLEQDVDGKRFWDARPPTARLIRGRIESVLDWARVRGYRDADKLNPATWCGHIDKMLPATSKVHTVSHHDALPFDQLAGFMNALRHASLSVRKLLSSSF